MLSSVNSRPDYLPPAMLDWAERYAWLLDEVASRWLDAIEPPKRADLQQALMARGSDVYLADVLHEMPTPLGWIESQDQRIVLSLFGLRVAPCMKQQLVGLGGLVAIAVSRYRTSGPRASISVGDIERELHIPRSGALALSTRLFAELPFLGSTVSVESAQDGEARDVREDVVRYASVRTTDDYLKIRANEIRGHPQFGWGRWELSASGETVYAIDSTATSRRTRLVSPTQRLINHPWVVGIGTIVVGGVILALILGHG
jgi:hypothetical protein